MKHLRALRTKRWGLTRKMMVLVQINDGIVTTFHLQTSNNEDLEIPTPERYQNNKDGDPSSNKWWINDKTPSFKQWRSGDHKDRKLCRYQNNEDGDPSRTNSEYMTIFQLRVLDNSCILSSSLWTKMKKKKIQNPWILFVTRKVIVNHSQSGEKNNLWWLTGKLHYDFSHVKDLKQGSPNWSIVTSRSTL